MSDNILLSFLIPGKNSNDYYGSFERLKICLSKHLSNVSNPKYSNVEIVLADWGSENKIIDTLQIPKNEQFRCVYASPEITKKYNKDANYSIPHPINMACRYSRGKYVVFCDCDVYVSTNTFERIVEFVETMQTDNDKSFYWSSRYHIPLEVHSDTRNFTELDNYLHNLNLDTIPHDKINTSYFQGCSSALLMDKELWLDSTGFWEILNYWGWQDIEFHHRLASKYRFGGDIEDLGMPFFHLAHPSNPNRRTSPQIMSNLFQANGSIWGLSNENIEII